MFKAAGVGGIEECSTRSGIKVDPMNLLILESITEEWVRAFSEFKVRGAGQIPLTDLGKPEIEHSFLPEFSSKLFYAVYLTGMVCLYFLCMYLIKRLKMCFIICSGTCESSDSKCI